MDELAVGHTSERPGDEVQDGDLGLRVARRQVDDQALDAAIEHVFERVADQFMVPIIFPAISLTACERVLAVKVQAVACVGRPDGAFDGRAYR